MTVAAGMEIQAVGAVLRQRGSRPAVPAICSLVGNLNPVKRAFGDLISSLEFRLGAISSPARPLRGAVGVEEAGSSFRLSLHLTSEAGRRMRAATQDFPGRRMAVLVDGKIPAAPVIRGAIGEDAVIDAGFSRDEA